MQTTRRLIAIGGGEIKDKTTKEIDAYIASLVKEKANGERGNALFVGTASHDSMPYFNSFRKTYTSLFDIKCDVALMVYGEMNMEHIQEKVERADLIYIGGGNTLYMIQKWKENGFLKLLQDAYQKGTIIAGLSAGAICHFEKMYSDQDYKECGEYHLYDGLGTIKGCMSPHYNERLQDFDQTILEKQIPLSYAIENNCAIEFINEEYHQTLTSGGNAYLIQLVDHQLQKTLLEVKS